MIRKTGFLLLLVLVTALSATAQKVKYKDLFLLLNAKEYQKAEPFLKRYLKDNTDNPNAYLFMGIIYQDKAAKADVLRQSEAVGLTIDSAVNNYAIALRTITEKEVKRNDEYYENYRRRDLRTAESGIKLSDIQFDLEQRIKALKEKKERVKALKDSFVETEKAYERTNRSYRKIQDAYPGQKEFLLRADENAVKQLKLIISAADSGAAAFNTYKITSQLIGKTGYNQVLDVREIHDLKQDGTSLADFYKDDVRVWNYRQWALSSISILEKDIFPLRENLILCDIDINKVRVKLKKDSVSVEDDLNSILHRPVFAQLKQYDPDPLPLAIFKMKAAELDYASDVIVHRKNKDSLNVNLRLAAVRSELKKARKLDSLTALLTARNMESDYADYSYFVTNAYGSQEVLGSLIRTTKDFADRETEKKKKEEARRTKSLTWLINAADSVPLFVDATIKKNKYKPLIITPDDNTAGIKYVDSLATGYFFTITPTRIPDIKASFPVPASGFNRRNLPILKAMTTHDENNQVYFAVIYSEAKTKDKFTVVVAKIYRTDGLAWSRTYPLDMIPSSVSFASDTGELSIKLTSAAGDHKIVVLDKAGKQLQ